MELGKVLKTIREARNLSQKELAGLINMKQAQYSRLENGKTDPAFTVVVRIANALGVTLSELFQAEEIFSQTNSFDKTLTEKIRLIESLDETEKVSIYNIVDSLIAKKKLKDNIQNLANL